MKCSFQELPAPEIDMNTLKLSCKENFCCADQAKVAPVVCHLLMVRKLSLRSIKVTPEDAVHALVIMHQCLHQQGAPGYMYGVEMYAYKVPIYIYTCEVKSP